ncbi:RHS repeat-associated core domain-containing protein, partial [Candidatus Uhrbacteria bacterium]|nr:RHS repeat-associated core domain-containing protein [Candidatus Uhrbacteria bacterium]
MLTKTTLVGTADEETTTFVYDEARVGYFNKGALTSMRDAAGYRTNDYDELGRPKRVERTIDATPYVFTHSYNTAGLPESTTYPDAQTISWTYDTAGNLQTETGTITTAVYDAAGRPTSLSFANGVITTYSFSPTRGWLDNVHTQKDAIVHQDLTYTRYADGMIQNVTSAKAMETWTYVYDDLNRLSSATNLDTPSLSQSFIYDQVGNVTYNSQIGTYTYPTPGTDQPHAVQTAGTRTYLYDDVGRMINRNGQVIQWNGDGKPKSIGSALFTYGGTGERLKKVSGGQTTRYVGGDYEIAHDGKVTKYLIGGKQVGTSFFIQHRDHLGSIQAITDAAGVEVRRQDHTPFGNQHYASGSHAESRGWIDEREEETELLYLNARYYDPEIGRFTAPDPIMRLGQKLNRYAYARNNPINLSDPSGLYESCTTVTNTGTFDPGGANIPTHAPTSSTTCHTIQGASF